MPQIHEQLLQGSDEWLEARRGLITASEMKLLVTPTLKVASNDKTRLHLYELAAQRLTKHVEQTYISDDMLRGMQDEIDARDLYSEKVAPVQEVGLITNSRWGFTLAYSPDGLVGENGLIECKSRRQKYHVQTMSENVVADQGETIPSEFMLQVQTALLVSEREWLDFISYSAGMPMIIIRVYPDSHVHEAIIAAAADFECRIAKIMHEYWHSGATQARLIETPPRNPRNDGEMVP